MADALVTASKYIAKDQLGATDGEYWAAAPIHHSIDYGEHRFSEKQTADFRLSVLMSNRELRIQSGMLDD